MKSDSSGSWKRKQNLRGKIKVLPGQGEVLSCTCFLVPLQLLENARNACDPSSIFRAMLMCLS